MNIKIAEKAWSSEIEKKILEEWRKDNPHNNNDNDKIHFEGDGNIENPFVLDTPPPYPSGKPWHIGAAAHYSQIDMIARTARSQGFNVIFPIGIDRNGIPVEIYTEKKYKIRMRNTDRKEFLKLCENTLDETEKEFVEILKSLGISADFDNKYHTDSEEFRTLTQATFIEMWKRNLIYWGDRPNNYCIDCGTTIADAEISYIDMETKLVYIKFYLNDEKDFIVIATTRPELIFACQAVIVNPGDNRYKQEHEKILKIPLFNREIKIVPHKSVDPEFGTGAVMVCSFGDLNDVQLFREMGLKEIKSIDQRGKTTENAGQFSNLSVKEARARIIEELNDKGFVQKIEKITHRTPIC
ncbi:MAG: class I tRNA ligase family protein [Thermoproteota archaeon]|nr:class I tRNA ligase family protein [Thermoproteota archaeon]